MPICDAVSQCEKCEQKQRRVVNSTSRLALVCERRDRSDGNLSNALLLCHLKLQNGKAQASVCVWWLFLFFHELNVPGQCKETPNIKGRPLMMAAMTAHLERCRVFSFRHVSCVATTQR